jgi:hypothetical protein
MKKFTAEIKIITAVIEKNTAVMEIITAVSATKNHVAENKLSYINY